MLQVSVCRSSMLHLSSTFAVVCCWSWIHSITESSFSRSDRQVSGSVCQHVGLNEQMTLSPSMLNWIVIGKWVKIFAPLLLACWQMLYPSHAIIVILLEACVVRNSILPAAILTFSKGCCLFHQSCTSVALQISHLGIDSRRTLYYGHNSSCHHRCPPLSIHASVFGKTERQIVEFLQPVFCPCHSQLLKEWDSSSLQAFICFSSISWLSHTSLLKVLFHLIHLVSHLSFSEGQNHPGQQ
jgi:hypothetical protein